MGAIIGSIVAYYMALEASTRAGGTHEEIMARAMIIFLGASVQVLVIAGGLAFAFFHPRSGVPGRKVKVLAWTVAISMAVFAVVHMLKP